MSFEIDVMLCYGHDDSVKESITVPGDIDSVRAAAMSLFPEEDDDDWDYGEYVKIGVTLSNKVQVECVVWDDAGEIEKSYYELLKMVVVGNRLIAAGYDKFNVWHSSWFCLFANNKYCKVMFMNGLPFNEVRYQEDVARKGYNGNDHILTIDEMIKKIGETP